jgi:hypothetical protein
MKRFNSRQFIRLARSSLLPLTVLCLVLSATGEQAEIVFPVAHLHEWEQKSFYGETAYTVEKLDGKAVLKAESSGTASGYYRRLSLKASEYPLVNWSWKIGRTIAAEDAYRKSGDDYAARVYVVFPGRFFWQYRALIYVWSDKLPPGTIIKSPYSERIAIIALESGNRFAGEWRHESRNYRNDYRAYFHKEPVDPIAVAFMTDSDNTGSHAVAWYGDIFFSR